MSDGQAQDAPRIETWEWEMLQAVARKYGKAGATELEGVLLDKLIELKEENRIPRDKPRGYLFNTLRNCSFNWLRDERRRRVREVALIPGPADSADDEESGVEVIGAADDLDTRIALKRTLACLDPPLRDVVRALHQRNGDRKLARQDLDLHRNTFDKRLKRVHAELTSHGLGRISHNWVTHQGKLDARALEERRRLAVLLLRSESQTAVAKRLGVARQTVNRWAAKHRIAGRTGLSTADPGRPSKLTPEQQTQLRAMFLRESRSLTEWAEAIYQRWGVRYHPGHVWKIKK